MELSYSALQCLRAVNIQLAPTNGLESNENNLENIVERNKAKFTVDSKTLSHLTKMSIKYDLHYVVTSEYCLVT